MQRRPQNSRYYSSGVDPLGALKDPTKLVKPSQKVSQLLRVTAEGDKNNVLEVVDFLRARLMTPQRSATPSTSSRVARLVTPPRAATPSTSSRKSSRSCNAAEWHELNADKTQWDALSVLQLPLRHPSRRDIVAIKLVTDWVLDLHRQGVRFREDFPTNSELATDLLDHGCFYNAPPLCILVDDESPSFIAVISGKAQRLTMADEIIDVCIMGQTIGMGTLAVPKEGRDTTVWATIEGCGCLIFEDSDYHATSLIRKHVNLILHHLTLMQEIFPSAPEAQLQKLIPSMRLKQIPKNSLLIDHSGGATQRCRLCEKESESSMKCLLCREKEVRQCYILVDASIQVLVKRKTVVNSYPEVVSADTEDLIPLSASGGVPARKPPLVPCASLCKGIVCGAMDNESDRPLQYTLKAERTSTVLSIDASGFKFLGGLLGSIQGIQEMIDEIDKAHTSQAVRSVEISGRLFSKSRPLGPSADRSFSAHSDSDSDEYHRRPLCMKNRAVGTKVRSDNFVCMQGQATTSPVMKRLLQKMNAPQVETMMVRTRTPRNPLGTCAPDFQLPTKMSLRKVPRVVRMPSAAASRHSVASLPPLTRHHSVLLNKFYKVVSRKSLLVMSDDPQVQKVVTRVYIPQQHHSPSRIRKSVFFVQNNTELLRALVNRTRYHLLVLDGSGSNAAQIVPLLRCIRSLPADKNRAQYGEVPIVILVNSREVSDDIKNATNYILFKPINVQGFREALVSCFHGLEDELSSAHSTGRLRDLVNDASQLDGINIELY
eukprot:GEMP01025229.1.p1 GENE.GEMP01025229.1~~GEMP01025229.1.p1  ORF type:complete len:771 (+),score=119.34 GEMP01025229.1:69-2381(+)